MSSKNFETLVQKELHQHNYVTLSLIKKKLHHHNDDQTIIWESLTYRHQHQNLEVLCFVTFQENNVVYSRYEVDSWVQQFLKNRKMQGKPIHDVSIQFLCIFDKEKFRFNSIVQMMIDSTKEMYNAALQTQIQRNLTVIPPNAIMKNGKKYSELNPAKSKTTLSQTSSKDSLTVNSNQKKDTVQKQKNQNTEQLPKIHESKLQIKKEQHKSKNIEKAPKKQQKKPTKKLQIQSDDSQDYYVPEKFIQNFQNKPFYRNQPMQIQNQGNFKQNQMPPHNRPQKMQIENPIQNQNQTLKQNSPGNNTNVDDEEDSMVEFMKEMDKKKAAEKSSIGAKSVPGVKQIKLDFSKVEPAKSVASKQGSLLSWMPKK